MNYYMGTFLVILVCMTLLLVCAMRKRLEWLINIVMRGVLGIISIYFINLALGYFGIFLGVGMNAVTVLTSGILGFPGLLALYALALYQLL